MYLKFGVMKMKKTMIFNITKASDFEYKEIKEFNSLDEIRDFVEKASTYRYCPAYCPACVLYFSEDELPELQIYDTWIE